jgi:hypothetical protein
MVREMNEHAIHVDVTDTHVAFDCEAKRAKSEGFKGVAERQAATALHIRNAQATMSEIVPAGHRLRMRIVFDFVPNVNPVLRDEVREGRA